MSDFKDRHFTGDIILWAVHWYCKYGVNYRELAEVLQVRPQVLGINEITTLGSHNE